MTQACGTLMTQTHTNTGKPTIAYDYSL